jgi:type I restriction enzyme S subunit
MRQEKLSELLDISIGRTPSRNEPSYWGKGHRWVSIRDLSSKIVTETKEQITNLAVKDARCKIVKKGTLLFSFKLTIGKMAFAGCDLFTNEAIAAFAIKDEKELNPEFLYYALQSATYGGSNQAVMGKTLNSKSLAEIEIPLPSLDDQIRIAHLLTRVEGLIAQRKQHLQQLDDLLKSVFLEIFGDPVRNEKGWDTTTLPQLVLPGKNSLKRGPFGGALKKDIFVETGYLVYEQHHALNNDYSFARYFINEEKYQELIDFKVVPGDVLISCSGVYLGKLSIVPANSRPGIINQALLKVSLDPQKIEHRFFVHVFGSPQFKEKYFPSNRGGAIPNLPPMSVMKEIPFIYPPLNLQQEFTNVYEKMDALKSEYHQSLTDLEALYGVLSQQAFKGELDLSRVALPAAPIEGESPVAAGVPAPIATPVIELPETDLLLPAMHVLNET